MLLLMLGASARAQEPVRDGVQALLAQLEQTLQAGDPGGYAALLAPSADRAKAADFAGGEIFPGATHVVVKERDREALAALPAGDGYRLIVEALVEYGQRARIMTWRFDVRRARGGADTWQISDEEHITSVENLYRLSLDPAKEFDARNLHIAAEDLEIALPAGAVFVAGTDQGITGLVLLGRGTMRFHPTPETERGQVKIFCGAETLDAEFDAAYVRINPGDYAEVIDERSLTARAVDPEAWRRADAMFREESVKSFNLDLADLSHDQWSLLPPNGDFLAEIRTRRYGTLTYGRSGAEPEDITLFDRRKRRNIALYASKATLAQRGPFYNEDDLADYDVIDYALDVAVAPERSWIDGHARMTLKIRAPSVTSLTIRLADPLVVQSIVSDRFGRLFGIRVRDQNSFVINLPTTLMQDSRLTLVMDYAGRLEPQAPDSETLGQIGRPDTPTQPDDEGLMTPERSFLYSNRSYWYPQNGVSDYATATIRLTVPAAFECVASGELSPGFPVLLPAENTEPARKVYQFAATEPARYLSFVISRFVRAETVTIVFPVEPQAAAPAPADGTPLLPHSLSVSVETNPRQVARGHEAIERAIDIAQYYTSLVGDCPYPSFTVALVERDLPGGHSPAYFALLNQPLPTSHLSWRNDPASFPNYPEFFIAHEMAHQWWGQAVGWRNYHEQWISEAFAQYFAALYAQHRRGDDTFYGLLHQFRRWALEDSDQGPVYLGYRLGHIRGEGRVFRAIVYNKGAAVLHMLRRLVGDEAFFRGLRRFYRTSRFQKAGTEQFRKAMEAESGRPLERFFNGWIYGSALPRIRFTYRVEGDGRGIVLHVEQLTEQTFEFPLVVTIRTADQKKVDVMVPVDDHVVDFRAPLTAALKDVEVRTDEMLAQVVR